MVLNVCREHFKINYIINEGEHIWAKGIGNVPYWIQGWLSRKCNEDDDSPNKFYMLVTYVLVTTLKNIQTVNVDEH